MSDIVDRLRKWWVAWGSPVDRDQCINETCMAMDCKEAADLIERLRAELDDETKLHLENEAKNMALVIGLKDQIDSLRLDAERLRAALLMMKHAFESDNRPNMLIVDAALSAAHGTEGKT